MPSVVGSAIAPPPTAANRRTSAIAVASSVRRRLSRTLTHCWRTHQRVASETSASANARPSSLSTGRNATWSRTVNRCSWMLAGPSAAASTGPNTVWTRLASTRVLSRPDVMPALDLPRARVTGPRSSARSRHAPSRFCQPSTNSWSGRRVPDARARVMVQAETEPGPLRHGEAAICAVDRAAPRRRAR